MMGNLRDTETDFDQFWRAYPRRVAKADARKAWRQTAAIRPPLPVLLEAVERARRTEQWRRDGGQYIPYPATWLRGERWDDECEVAIVSDADARPWHETRSGLIQRGAELGLKPADFPHFPAFKVGVMQAHRLAVQGSASGNVTAFARRRA